MLTYTYKTTNGGEESISTRVRDVLGLGSQSFPLMNLNGTPVKLTRNGVTVTVSKVAGVYRMESKQDGVKYRESFSGGASGWILLLSGDFVELTDDVSTLEWEFVTNGGLLHRFSLTRDDKKSRTSDVAVKMEDGSASASAVVGAPKAAEIAEAPKADTAEAPKATETAEAPKAAEATKPTETPKRLRPDPDVVARSQARANAQEKFQADGAAALPGSNWGNPRPILKNVTFNQAAVDAKERADYLRRRREEMVADLSGGAAGGSVDDPTQAMGFGGKDTQVIEDPTQAMDFGGKDTQVMEDPTQAMDFGGKDTQVIEDPTQVMGLGGNEAQVHVVDGRYAVLTVTKAPIGVLAVGNVYELEKKTRIGRESGCEVRLNDTDTFSRTCAIVNEDDDTRVSVKVLNKNGIILKNTDGVEHIAEVRDGVTTIIYVDFGGEFSIRRGGAGNEGPANYVTFKVTKPM
jgi:hypothetical protein